MYGKASLFLIVVILIAGLLLTPAFAPSLQKIDKQATQSADPGRHVLPAAAESPAADLPVSRVIYLASRHPSVLARMNEGEMRSAGADHGLWMAALEDPPTGRPVSRVIGTWGTLKGKNDRTVAPAMADLPEAVLERITAGKTPIIWTLSDQDLAVTYWAPLYELLEPIAEKHELWVPIHRFKIHRAYYDVTMERYGWEIDDFTLEDLKNEWRRFHITGVGQQGRALPLELIVVDNYKYRPGGWDWRHGITEPFREIGGGGRVSWFWRQGYVVHFEKY